MNREEVINLMLNSINNDNRAICAQGGMPEEEISQQIDQSQPTLYLLLSNIYDKLVNAELIRSS